MITYFKELLKTLMLIEQHLRKISSCVSENHRRHGKRVYLSTGHWNE